MISFLSASSTEIPIHRGKRKLASSNLMGTVMNLVAPAGCLFFVAAATTDNYAEQPRI